MLYPRIGSGLLNKQTRLERLFRDKHSSSLPTFTKYDPEGVKTKGPGLIEANIRAYLLKHQ
jgi:hypothetical protein